MARVPVPALTILGIAGSLRRGSADSEALLNRTREEVRDPLVALAAWTRQLKRGNEALAS